MADLPVMLGNVGSIQMMRTLPFQRPELSGQWVKYVDPRRPGQDWYVRTSPDGHGESCSALPDGERSAASIELQADNRVLLRLEALGAELRAAGEHYQWVLDVIRAADEGFNASVTAASLSRLRDSRLDDALTELTSTAGAVVAQRKRLAADLHLFGGLATACTLLFTARARGAHPDVLHHCLQLVREPDVIDPWQLLGSLTRRMLRSGLANVVTAVADDCRDQASSLLGSAVRAPTIDQAMDHLYRAQPMSVVASSLHGLVASEGPNHLRRRSKNAHRVEEERSTRIRVSFAHHTLDVLDGSTWYWDRTHVAAVRRERGDGAARRLVGEWVEREYRYPRGVVPDLLL